MKEIKLTKGLVALVDDEDFKYLNQWKWCACKNHNTWYAGRSIKRINKQEGESRQITVKMHRVIMKIEDSETLIDHEDHNGLNNQKYNLRVGKHIDNVKNTLPQKNTISIYKGVGPSYRRRPWRARIFHENKRITLGTFNTEIEAAVAYNEAAIKYYGKFAWLNPIPNDSPNSDNS